MTQAPSSPSPAFNDPSPTRKPPMRAVRPGDPAGARTPPDALLTPHIPDYLDSVIALFSSYIPEEEYEACVVVSGGLAAPFPTRGSEDDQQGHLALFVRQQLNRIACFELTAWLNGRMPFVTLRDLQIWRFYQFCRHIWTGRIPKHEHVAAIFNLTQGRARSLVNDFYARFRKQFLYPLFLKEILETIRRVHDYNKKPEQEAGQQGRWIPVRDSWYVEEMNVLLSEPLVQSKLRGEHKALTRPDRPAALFLRETVIEVLLDLQSALLAMYPILREEGDD